MIALHELFERIDTILEKHHTVSTLDVMVIVYEIDGSNNYGVALLDTNTGGELGSFTI